MEEASTKYRSHELRTFYATILAHCTPSEPLNLFEKFKDELT